MQRTYRQDTLRYSACKPIIACFDYKHTRPYVLSTRGGQVRY